MSLSNKPRVSSCDAPNAASKRWFKLGIGGWVVPALLFIAAGSHAQTVTNARSGTDHATLSEGISVAEEGDTLFLDGDFDEGVVVDKTLTLVSLTGATLSADGANIIELAPSVELRLSGLTLSALPTTRGILAPEDNVLEIEESTFLTGTNLNGQHGGAIHIVDHRSLQVVNTVFSGDGFTTQARRGGAIYAAGHADDYGSVVLDTVRFENIRSGAHGGAVYAVNVDLECMDCVFEKTRGTFGGAVYSAFSNVRIERGRFCNTIGSLGGAVFSSGETEIRSSVFAYTNGINTLYANGGNWTVINNHFVANEQEVVHANALGDSIQVTNNLFLGTLGDALDISTGIPSTVTYNYFFDNVADSSDPLDATNITDGGDPLLVDWSDDGDCENDRLWPSVPLSPLLDAGDPAIRDPDGSRSDVGAFGGPNADPSHFADGDGDGHPRADDCDDSDASVSPSAPEICDGIDNDCDSTIDLDPVVPDAFHADCDGDGQGQPTASFVQCFEPPTAPACGGSWLSRQIHGELASSDCDDTDSATYVGAPESCAPGDQNCDGDDDQGATDHPLVLYVDEDGDGYGVAPVPACFDMPGDELVTLDGDCDDENHEVHPGALELCDLVDTNCDGRADPEGCCDDPQGAGGHPGGEGGVGGSGGMSAGLGGEGDTSSDGGIGDADGGDDDDGIADAGNPDSDGGVSGAGVGNGGSDTQPNDPRDASTPAGGAGGNGAEDDTSSAEPPPRKPSCQLNVGARGGNGVAGPLALLLCLGCSARQRANIVTRRKRAL